MTRLTDEQLALWRTASEKSERVFKSASTAIVVSAFPVLLDEVSSLLSENARLHQKSATLARRVVDYASAVERLALTAEERTTMQVLRDRLAWRVDVHECREPALALLDRLLTAVDVALLDQLLTAGPVPSERIRIADAIESADGYRKTKEQP